jgi:outer membrane receptor protein involved in Fe transport
MRRLTLLFAFVLLPAVAWAQAERTGTINGKVVDDKGAAVAGATVQVTVEDLGLEREATTGSNGEFLFALLPTGNYSVTVEASGWQPQVYRFRVGVGETVPVNVTLTPGGEVTEEITVTGTATSLETTETGENFKYESEVDVLPINDRGIEDVAGYSPNMSYGPTPGTYAISGAPSFDTTVLLDGSEVSDPYFGSAPELFLEDAVEEVQVLTSGVSARYGRFQGGVINAITKSGGNEFEGTLRTELFKEEWNSTTPFDEDQDDKLNKIYQATLGGYVVRDRLWFFVGGRTIPTAGESLTTEFTSESFTQTREEDRWQAKLRGALSANHLVDLSYLSYESSVTNDDGLPPGDDLALGIRKDPRESWTLSYQGVLSSNTFLEFQATEKKVSIEGGGDPAKGDPILDLNLFQVFHNHWWDANDPSVRDNQTAGLSATHSRDFGNAGSHVFEGGVQWVESTTGGENRQSSTGFNLLAFNPDFVVAAGAEPRFNLRTGGAVRWEALPLGGQQKIENQAAYLQDTWTLDKFRFDVGVRYETYEGSGPIAQLALDYSDISPRLGVTYSLADNWQLQGTYGKYVSRFNDNVGNAVTGVSGAPRIETFYLGPTLLNITGDQVQQAIRNDAFWPIVTDFVAPDQPTSFLESDLAAPHANELTMSVRHALPRNSGSVVLSYIDREYKDLIDDFVGGACDYGIDFGRPCPAGNTTVVSLDGEPFAEVDSTLWANNSQARREYQAVILVWDYRPTSNWNFSGNYTYAKTEANYEGEGQNTPSSGSPLGDYERSVDIAAATPFGAADDDIRHRANLFSTYRFDFDRLGALTLGGLVTYESGLPYSLVAPVALRDDPAYLGDSGTYTHFFSGRGARRFNDWWSLDLSTRYDFKVYKDIGAFVKLSVLNVLNNDEVIQFQATGQAVLDAAGNPIAWQPTGNCGLSNEPSESCTGFGRIRNENDYQDPRTFLLTIAIDI